MMGYFDTQSPREARQQGYFGAPVRKPSTGLTPEEERSLMEEVSARSLPAAEGLLGVLDTPASWLRDILTLKPIGSRTTPGELLDAYQLRPSEKALGGWGRPLAEFAAGAGLDPLNLVSFGGAGLAAKAAKGVTIGGGRNLLDDAARVMSRRMVAQPSLRGSFAENALDSWKTNFGRSADDLTDADLIARPLAGTRQSRRNLTLEDLVEAQPAANRQDIIQRINNNLARNKKTYQDVAQDTLRQDIGIGLPFSDHNIAGRNLPGGEWLASGLDRAGQAIRWSGPMRHAHAAFNKEVFGATDEAGQIIGKEVSQRLARADEDSGKIISEALQSLGPDVLKSKPIAQSMARVLDGVPTDADNALLASRPDLQNFADEWHKPGGLAEQYLQRRMDAGLASAPLVDLYGGKYFPRHVDDLSFMSKIEEDALLSNAKGGGAGRGGRSFSTMTGDQLARRSSMHVPGGRETLNKLSLDPNVAGPGRSKATDDLAAEYIKGVIDQEIKSRFTQTLSNGKKVLRLPNGAKPPTYSLAKAKQLARTLHQLDPESIKRGLPMFGSHFAGDFARYVKGNERALAMADVLTDFMGQAAKPIAAGAVQGGRHIPLRNAIRRVGLRTVTTATPGATPLPMKAGAGPQLLARLSQRFPGAAKELKKYSIDERMVQRLTRIADFYDYPKVQQGWTKAFDNFTRVWKASVLAWPARFVRDWYSGAFSNLVEVGNAGDLWNGYTGAKALIQGNWQELDRVLEKAPMYKGMSAATRRREFLSNISSADLLGGRRGMDISDAMDAMQSGADVADEFLPGMNPRTTMGYQAWDALTGQKPLGVKDAAYSELGQNWDRFRDMGWKRSRDVGNPIMRWSQKLGDTTDSINRASGYIGLLLQGVDPLEAARRMKAAHVDYGSLTKFERETMRRFLPFWSYTSRTGKWIAEKILEKPGGRLTQFGMRAPETFLRSGDDQYVPDSIRGNFGMPVDVAYARPFGRDQAGSTPWLTDIDLPTNLINMFSPKFSDSGRLDLTQTAWNSLKGVAGQQMHAVPRMFLERVLGENLYTKRPLKDFDPALSELLRDTPFIQLSPSSTVGQAVKDYVAPLVDLVPFMPRTFQTVNRLMDSDKIPDFRDRLYQTAINSTTGVKFQNVSDQARDIDVKKNIGEMMEENPLVRQIRMPYISEEDMLFADPRLVRIMALERSVGKRLKEARMRRDGIPLPKSRRAPDAMSYFG